MERTGGAHAEWFRMPWSAKTRQWYTCMFPNPSNPCLTCSFGCFLCLTDIGMAGLLGNQTIHVSHDQRGCSIYAGIGWVQIRVSVWVFSRLNCQRCELYPCSRTHPCCFSCSLFMFFLVNGWEAQSQKISHECHGKSLEISTCNLLGQPKLLRFPLEAIQHWTTLAI